MEKSVLQIVKNDMCIGCGLCETSCPESAIKISFSNTKEYQPIVDPVKCTNCGICTSVCPSSPKNLNGRFNNIKIRGISSGTNKAIAFYRGFEIDYKKYEESSSGGVLSALVKYLLSEKIIDTVVHAQMNFGDSENVYFSSCISKTAEEIDNNRSSFYYPIEFSKIVKQIKTDDTINKVAILGVPCALSGFHYLCKKDKILNKKISYKFTLICSHNTNGQFAENLRLNIRPGDQPAKIKFRDKKGITEALNFNNSLLFQSGERASIDRNTSGFTKKWRTYNYALNGCLYCPDFFGFHADAGFKDAWGIKTGRPQGETLCFINNPEIEIQLQNTKAKKIISLTEIGKDQFIYSQKDTLVYKQLYSLYRRNQNKPLIQSQKIPFKTSLIEKILLMTDLFFKKRVIKRSKRKWLKGKKSISGRRLKILELIFRKINVFLVITSRMRFDRDEFNIIYTSGFGYNNIGDEAQLNSNLKIWKEIAPEASVTLLSPNSKKTREVHGNYDILKASRNSLWGFRGVEYAGIGNKNIYEWFFRVKFSLLKINCFFIKHFNTSFGLNPEASMLLFQLKNARLIHIGGGGFLTGRTSSRLYDFFGLIWIANYLQTDIILSGHNIGIWKTAYQIKLARQLNKAELIGLRDNEDSIKDLKKIKKFDSKKVYSLFDDALFCEDLSDEQFEIEMYNRGIDISKNIIAINVHYWIHDVDEINQTLTLLSNSISKFFDEGHYELVFIPQDPNDKPAIEYLCNQLNQKTTILDYNFNFKLVVSTYKKAHLTITMKHHPIIFSMAGCTPTIALSIGDYYVHKNKGAMMLFGMEKYSLPTESLIDDSFNEALLQLLTDYELIEQNLNDNLNKKRKFKGFIIKEYLRRKGIHNK